jgi:hypothetical protein
MPAPTLNGRLICASNCAYEIRGEGALPLDDTDRYYAGVGFVQPPTAFVGAREDIDACFVGTIPDGVVVAFRGTLPPVAYTLQILLDWINDIKARPIVAPGMPGRVHEGFLLSLDSLWEKTRAEARRQLDLAGADAKLFITGHSKGGGIAPLAAWRFLQEDKIVPRVVTFAGAKCGDFSFAQAYDAVIAQDRFEFDNDIVPHLPASDHFLKGFELPFVHVNPFKNLEPYDYQPTGTLRYILSDFSVIDDAPGLADQRLKGLASAVLHLHFQQIGDDHRVGCGFGYMGAACPTGVCAPP